MRSHFPRTPSNFQREKLDYINHLNKFLGIELSSTANIMIARKHVEGLNLYLEIEYDKIYLIFGFTPFKITKYETHHTFLILRKIYENWNSLKITSNKNTCH